MRKILFLLLIGSLTACSPQYRFRQLLAQHPELYPRDSVIQLTDTLFIKSDSAVTHFNADTLKVDRPIVVSTAHTNAIVKRINDKTFTLKTKQRPDTVTVEKEVKVPVYITEKQKEYIPVYQMNRNQRLFYKIGVATVVLMLFGALLFFMKRFYLQ